MAGLDAEAAAAQEALDREVNAALEDCRNRNLTLHCRRGCANCCRLAVHATWPEAERLAEQLSETQQATLAGHVAQLRTLAAGCADLITYLSRYRREINGCPFLETDGACGVYPFRPLSCRALLSTRPGDWCGVNLAALPDLDKQLYLASLDPELVDYPTHYLVRPRMQGQVHEKELLSSMADGYGFTLAGNLAALTSLALQGLGVRLVEGHAAVSARLISLGFPEWLVWMDAPAPRER